MVADIPKEYGDARPRIVACFERSDVCKRNNDIASVGWMLTAIEERVNERELRNWRNLRGVIKIILMELPSVKPTVH